MPLANPDVERLAEAISTLFHPHVEVALHDLSSGRIVRLWNPISGRRRGDESLIEPDFQSPGPNESVIGPYEQVDVRGHRTTSVSVPVDEGRMLLCINFDRSALDGAIGVLMSLAAARFVRDPREVVKAGDVVKVKVLDVDAVRKRIALSMRLEDEAVASPCQPAPVRREPTRKEPARAAPAKTGTLGELLLAAQKARH